MKPLEVWGATLMSHGRGTGQQVRAIVAVRSRAAAARAFGVSDYFIKDWGAVTGNDEEIAVATAEPGTVFWHPLNRQAPGGWKRWDER